MTILREDEAASQLNNEQAVMTEATSKSQAATGYKGTSEQGHPAAPSVQLSDSTAVSGVRCGESVSRRIRTDALRAVFRSRLHGTRCEQESRIMID